MKKANDPINFKKAMKIFSNDIKLYIELFDQFLIKFPEYMNEMKKALEISDNYIFKFYAHKIKSNFISLGADDGAEIAGQLEDINLKNSNNNLQIKLSSLIDEFEKIKNFYLIYKNK